MGNFFASLRVRLLLLVLLALVPMLGLTVYGWVEERGQAVMEAQEKARGLAQRAANNQERMVEGVRQLLVALAEVPAVRSHDKASCTSLMIDLLAQYPLYKNLGAATPDGEIFCSAVPTTADVSMASRSHFQRALRSRDFVVGEYVDARIADEPVIPFAYPALSQSGEVEAIVFAWIDLDWLNGLIAEAQLPEGAILTVIDDAGTVLASYPGPIEEVGLTVSPSMRQLLMNQEAGVAEGEGEGGVPYLYGFTRLCCLAEGNIYVSVSIPQRVAFAEANRILARNLIALGASALLAFCLAWFGSDVLILRRVNAILSAAKRLGSGDLSARTGLSGHRGELQQLANTFDEMADALERRESACQQVVDALQRETAVRAALLEKIISAQEDERRRIARELHDETSQSLTALALNIEIANMALTAGRQDATHHLQVAKSIAEGMMENIRRLINDLRPSLLDDFGLVPAIAWYGDQRLKPQGIAVDFRHDGIEGRLPPAIETALFRIAQEAITNVVKHAAASTVHIALQIEDGSISLCIEDDGKGFEVAPSGIEPIGGAGVGLQGIQERVSILGGELTLQSAPGEGTRIRVRIPLPEEKIHYVQDSFAHRG